MHPKADRHRRDWIQTIPEMSSWDQANRREKLGFVLKSRKKISQIISDYLYLQFSLLFLYGDKVMTDDEFYRQTTEGKNVIQRLFK